MGRELSNKMGTIVEDIIYPWVRRIAREHFCAPEEMEFEAQLIKRKQAAGDRREFDGVFVWERHVLLLEAKATVRPEYLEAFDRFVRDYVLPIFPGIRRTPAHPRLLRPSPDGRGGGVVDRAPALCRGDGRRGMELLNAKAIDSQVGS